MKKWLFADASNESGLKKKCFLALARMKKNGEPVEFMKNHGSGMSRAGEPDVFICYRGRFIAVELKDKTELSEIQKFRLAAWKKAGAVTCVPRTVSDLMEALMSCT